ncbi:IkappaB kinase complex IKAP component [Panus rudis PR-1116 ss-1]|nr:IkappaB kinase complex IKAP component [Panus rudis PR-1116 ss-1]
MRNLSLYRTVQHTLNTVSAAESVSAVTFDLDQDVLYVACERLTEDGEVQVKVWRVEEKEEDSVNVAGTGVEEEVVEDVSVSLVITFNSPSYLVSNPWSSSGESPHELVSFKFLPDSRTLALIMRQGDIATASLEDEIVAVDVVGSVEAGIMSASWSPDDSLLVLATGDDKLILMTSTFDVVSETTLHPADFGEDAPINVGWGSKQTQFHGSLGKAAAQAPKPSVIGSSPDDDTLPRISWRGDGAFFSVSVLSRPEAPEGSDKPLRHRKFRVYSHAGILQSTSEPTPGLEHVLFWRPSGNWIVSTQRYGFEGGGVGREGRHDLVLFERNGLRRGEFEIQTALAKPSGNQVGKSETSDKKWGYRVKEVGWSSDSNILSIWVEKDAGDIVQLWTTGNYHWYLKHEITAPPTPEGQPGRFTSVTWHPENASNLVLTTTTQVIQRTYAWETYASRSKPPGDSGSVAVLDGASILLTPFRSQNVPPPMSAYQLTVPQSPFAPVLPQSVPVHLSFSQKRDVLAILWESGYLELTDLQTRLGPGKGKIMDPQRLWSGGVVESNENNYEVSGRFHQVTQWISERDNEGGVLQIAVLGSSATDVVNILTIEEGNVKRLDVNLPERNGRLLHSDHTLSWQSPKGQVYDYDSSSGIFVPVSDFPEFCFESERVSVIVEGNVTPIYVGLSNSNQLYIANDQRHRVLASNVNSFFVASGFLIYTTTAHTSQYAPLVELHPLLEALESPVPEWESRRVERGSRIVTVVPSTMSLVLQMPRGNLETIHPRPLVMRIVRQDFDRREYAKAFSACRRHRIDLNVFVEHNRPAFLQDISLFVDQVNDADHINLFLTNIGQGPLPDNVVSQVCDSIRVELEKRDLKKYVNSILTAHVVKRPPDHESALATLLRLRENEPQLVEDAVKYIIFLVDAEKLFDTALGMYDFSLVLLIAQHSQKDPREYLPFLRELRALDKYYQRFRIDDHLKRYEKALKNLSLAGSERFDEAMAYVEKHQLYDAALSIWRDTDKYETVLSLYGDWLFERREFRDAAFVYRKAKHAQKAMLAHERALDWQELFELAVLEGVSEGDISATAYRVAEDLSSKKRYQDSARVLLDYAKDVREAVISLVQGHSFSEARRIITLNSKLELLEDVIYPAALESRAQIAEEIGEMKEQLRKQVQRLRELRVKKIEEPDAFYGTEDAELHDVDVMTDVSMAPTAFTRYTVAPSTASRTSKRSSRSKRKMERKVGSGRKGTVDEEEYLLRSIAKLVGRFNATRNEGTHLLPHLFQFTEEHKAEGIELQRELNDLEEELKAAVDEIWTKKPEDVETTTAEGWAARMQEYEKQRRIDPLEKVQKPNLGPNEWNPKIAVLSIN